MIGAEEVSGAYGQNDSRHGVIITTTKAEMIQIHNHSSESMPEVCDESVHLVVTSPPYNCGVDYGVYDDSQDFNDYLAMLDRVWKECERVLVPGGRIAINVAHGIGRKPYLPLGSYLMLQIEQMFELKGTIIWQKGYTANSTAWGSWRSPADPSLRDTCEIIIVANKPGKFVIPDEAMTIDNNKKVSPWLDRDHFMWLTLDHWFVQPQTNRSIHPAPFPVEIPLRLAKLYAFPGATILDPFAGSGSTGLAAKELGLNCHLFEIDPNYCDIAKSRLQQETLF